MRFVNWGLHAAHVTAARISPSLPSYSDGCLPALQPPSEAMRYEEIAQPKPAPHEVLIKADAIGVKYVDIMRRSGKHPAAPKAPFTPGKEVCGRVAAFGEWVSRFRQGDRVIGRCVTHGTSMIDSHLQGVFPYCNGSHRARLCS